MWQAIVERMESEFGGTLSSATDWAVSAAILIGAAVAAWLLHAAILALVGRLSSERRPFLRSVLDATRNPTRRMIVPLSYFIEKPFQNWTRVGNELIGTVFLYVDHTAPVEAIRKKLTEIAEQSKLWNGKVVSLQVSDCKETTIELRALVSVNNAPAVWDLRCEVREKLIDFLQREHPEALPRRRYEAADVITMQPQEAPEIRAARRG
jgi:hypothetical protein